jgi:hypothetical protein
MPVPHMPKVAAVHVACAPGVKRGIKYLTVPLNFWKKKYVKLPNINTKNYYFFKEGIFLS